MKDRRLFKIILLFMTGGFILLQGCGGGGVPAVTALPGTGEDGETGTGEPASGETGTSAPETLPTEPAEQVPSVTDTSYISREQGEFPLLGYYGWPSVAVDEKDVTYVVVSKRLHHIDPYGRVMLYKSYDRGLTWDGGSCIYDTVLDDRDAGIVYMGGGRLLVTTFSHDAPLYLNNTNASWTSWQKSVSAGQLKELTDLWASSPESDLKGCSSYIISDDYGETWSGRHLMPLTAPHGPSMMNDGTLIYLGVPKAPEFATGKKLESGVYCYVSTDRGETFSERSKIGVDPEYKACEAYGIQLPDGTVVATVRTGDLSTLCFRSVDGGYTWTEAEKVTYGAPAHLVLSADGRTVVMSYSKRKDTTGQCVRLSTDGGASWGKEYYLSRPAGTADSDLGYPATARYSDGSFITVYYQKWKNDRKPCLMRTLWTLS
ncbi:MAG: exo-alpha-sialidase [Clostridia bacterium]|nr:exo-alpha-sialidase [Clostridia bacterium]